MLGCQSVQHVDSAQQRTSIRYAASKAKEKIRINSLQLLHFDSRDDRIVQESFQMDFSAGFHLLYGLTIDDIMAALKAAHTAADEYYTVRHALAWNTDFGFVSILWTRLCCDVSAQTAIISSQPLIARSSHARFQHVAGIRDKWHNAVGISWIQTRISKCSSVT